MSVQVKAKEETIEKKTPEAEKPEAVSEAPEAGAEEGAEKEAETEVEAEEADAEPAKAESAAPEVDAAAGKILPDDDSEEAKPPVSVSGSTDAVGNVKDGFGMSKEDLIAKLLTDPDAVIAELTEKVVAKVERKSQDQSEFKRAWDGFYEANSDLADFKDIVDLKARELRAKYKREGIDPSWTEAAKQLAEASRSVLKRARGSESDVEEVGNSKAVIASSSGSPAPRKSVKGDGAGGSFVNQVQKFQSKFR